MFRHVNLHVPHPNLLVGTNTLDDAGVFRLNDETALVQTVDYFTPVVDDAYTFGQIAAANALSDIYAMGARPLTVLNIVGFPVTKLPPETLAAILAGGANKVEEAGAVIVGGHSIDDADPKFGMAVTGTCHPERFWRNFGALPGDAIVLTKPLGVGIMTTAIKRGLATPAQLAAVTEVMTRLNRYAAQAGGQAHVHACTDVTGFGLLGHAYEMASQSCVNLHIHAATVPVLEGALALAEEGVVPGGSRRNASWLEDKVTFAADVGEALRTVLSDSITSGGLLFAVPQADSEPLVAALQAGGDVHAVCIGEAVAGSGRLVVDI